MNVTYAVETAKVEVLRERNQNLLGSLGPLRRIPFKYTSSPAIYELHIP
jgi:hypothetical protein